MSNNAERLYVVRSGAAANTSVAVALVAATAKTVVGVFGTAGTTLGLVRWKVSFDSVVATAVPAVVEIGVTSAAGTVGTAFTPGQWKGRALASACAAGYNHSAEPTYVRMLDVQYIPVNNGFVSEWYPLGMDMSCDISQGLAMRVTIPAGAANVNCLPSLMYAE